MISILKKMSDVEIGGLYELPVLVNYNKSYFVDHLNFFTHKFPTYICYNIIQYNNRKTFYFYDIINKTIHYVTQYYMELILNTKYNADKVRIIILCFIF